MQSYDYNRDVAQDLHARTEVGTTIHDLRLQKFSLKSAHNGTDTKLNEGRLLIICDVTQAVTKY